MHLVAKSPEDLLSSFTDEENEAYDTIINNIKDPNELSQILQEISLNNTISSRRQSNRRGYKQNQSISSSSNKKKKKTKPKLKQQQYDNNKVEDTTALANENYFMKQIRLIYEAAGSKIEFDNIDLEILIAIVDHFSLSSSQTKTKDNTAIHEDNVDIDEESLDAIEFSCNTGLVYALNNVMLGVTKAIFPASATWGEDC